MICFNIVDNENNIGEENCNKSILPSGATSSFASELEGKKIQYWILWFTILELNEILFEVGDSSCRSVCLVDGDVNHIAIFIAYSYTSKLWRKPMRILQRTLMSLRVDIDEWHRPLHVVCYLSLQYGYELNAT